jgi:hypothetical protein
MATPPIGFDGISKPWKRYVLRERVSTKPAVPGIDHSLDHCLRSGFTDGVAGDASAMVDGLRYETARDLFEAWPCAARAMLATPTAQPSLDFCRALLDGATPEEAVTFCAYLLPERAAIWWAHECLDHLADLLDAEDAGLLSAVADWVATPDEPGRRAALARAGSARAMTPAGRVALAAAGAQASGTGEHGTGEAECPVAAGVNAAILAALARVAIPDRFSVLSAFVEMGMQLAEIEALRQPAPVR